MKFAFTLIKYFPFGGLQRDFLGIAQTCLARGHQVDVLTSDWQGDVPYGLNVTVLRLNAWSNHRRRLALSREVRRRTQGKNYDAVVGFSKMPGLDFYFAGDSCFADCVQNKPFWYRFTGRCKTYLALERAVFDPQAHTRILLLAEKDQATYAHFYQTPSERFHILPPGIARDRMPPPDAEDIRRRLREELGIADDAHMVLMVGSGFRTKGTDRAMHAFAVLPGDLRRKALLVIIGKDNFNPFRRLAKRLDIADRVLFFHGRDDIPRFLFSADLLLHPAYRETAGIVLIEAMAAGLPVLATDVCGYSPYIARADAGRLIPSPFRQETLNHLLADMLLSPHRKTWSRNGHGYVIRHDVFSMHARAADLIEATVPC
jgi:UDP-glucose:(heptosyl)LPS alpha-1,3-glucosyltransferase